MPFSMEAASPFPVKQPGRGLIVLSLGPSAPLGWREGEPLAIGNIAQEACSAKLYLRHGALLRPGALVGPLGMAFLRGGLLADCYALTLHRRRVFPC